MSILVILMALLICVSFGTNQTPANGVERDDHSRW